MWWCGESNPDPSVINWQKIHGTGYKFFLRENGTKIMRRDHPQNGWSNLSLMLKITPNVVTLFVLLHFISRHKSLWKIDHAAHVAQK